MKITKTAVLATALFAASPMAMAATAFADMNVTLTINNSCTITTTPLSFGTSVDLDVAAIDAATTVRVKCTGKGPVNIGFGNGQNSTDPALRKMKHGTAATTVDYALYRDAARLEVLNNTTVRIGATSTGADQDFDVYGRVFKQAGAKETGLYSDVVRATVEF